VVQGLAGVSQWAGRQVGRLGLRSGSANGRLRGDELAEAQAYHDRNGDERLLLDDSRKWEQRDDPNFLSRPVPLPTVTSKYAGKPHDNGKPIPYLHYSLAYDADRRMAIYTVANFDRTRRSVPARGSDPFVPDSRVPPTSSGPTPCTKTTRSTAVTSSAARTSPGGRLPHRRAGRTRPHSMRR